MPEQLAVTERTTLHRLPARGSYERELVNAILDEALVCHLGFSDDSGPVVIPTTYVRVGDVLYVHGSPASRTLRTLAGGMPVCVTVTLLDGLVLARSAFHHSMNYRAVVVFGEATEVADPADKAEVLGALLERLQPGRSRIARPPSEKELRATLVLALPLEEASAKVRSGPPLDDVDDYALDLWAGEIPLRLERGAPVRDPGPQAQR